MWKCVKTLFPSGASAPQTPHPTKSARGLVGVGWKKGYGRSFSFALQCHLVTRRLALLGGWCCCACAVAQFEDGRSYYQILAGSGISSSFHTLENRGCCVFDILWDRSGHLLNLRPSSPYHSAGRKAASHIIREWPRRGCRAPQLFPQRKHSHICFYWQQLVKHGPAKEYSSWCSSSIYTSSWCIMRGSVEAVTIARQPAKSRRREASNKEDNIGGWRVGSKPMVLGLVLLPPRTSGSSGV